MEDHGAAHTTIVQRHSRGFDIRKVRVGAADGVMTLHQAVARVRGNPQRVIGMETVVLAVTSLHIDRHVVVAVGRRERAQRQGRRDVEADVARPVVGAVMGHGAVLVTHLQFEGARSHSVRCRRVRRVASVGEVGAYRLRDARDQTVRHRAQAVHAHIVLVDVRIVVVRHQERVEAGLAPVGVLHVDVVIDRVCITDGRQFPLRIDSVATRIENVAGDGAGIRHHDRRIAVDFVAELHRVQVDGVVIRQLRLDRVRSDIVRETGGGVIVERGDHHDARRNKLAVGKAHHHVVHKPAGAILRTGRCRGLFGLTELETEVGGVCPVREDKGGQVKHLMTPPTVGRHSCNLVCIPDGIHAVFELTARKRGIGRAFRVSVIEIAVTAHDELFPLAPVVVAVVIHTLGDLIEERGVIQLVHLANMVEIEVHMVDSEARRVQRNNPTGCHGVTCRIVHWRVETLWRRFIQLIIVRPVGVGDSDTGETPVTISLSAQRTGGHERVAGPIEIFLINGCGVHRLGEQQDRHHNSHQNE